MLLLHNGMGVARELSRCPNPLLTGITSHGAYEENGLLHHSRRGLTHIGPVNERARHYGHLADILHDALPDVAGMMKSMRPAGKTRRKLCHFPAHRYL